MDMCHKVEALTNNEKDKDGPDEDFDELWATAPSKVVEENRLVDWMEDTVTNDASQENPVEEELPDEPVDGCHLSGWAMQKQVFENLLAKVEVHHILG